MAVHSNTYHQNGADSVSQAITEKFKTSPVILGKPRQVLVFKQSEGSTGANDSNFGQIQGGGDSEKT